MNLKGKEKPPFEKFATKLSFVFGCTAGLVLFAAYTNSQNEKNGANVEVAPVVVPAASSQLGSNEAQTLQNYRGLLGALVLDGSVRVDHPAFEKYGIYPSVEQLPDGRKHVGIVETPGLGQPLEVVEP